MIKDEAREEIYDFFQHKRMYVAINCASVTLIPKTLEAKTMKEMRHIARWTNIYKIILKMLTMRLNKIISVIMDENQSTFVPGKIIHDNIMIAHELLRCYNRKHISTLIKKLMKYKF